jgi:hypothetical protein
LCRIGPSMAAELACLQIVSTSSATLKLRPLGKAQLTVCPSPRKASSLRLTARIFPRPTILRGEVSRDNSGGAEHEYDRKGEVPSLTKAQNPIQIVVLIAVSIITVWTLYMVPSWQATGDPFLLAAVVGAVTVSCLWLTRWLGSRAMKFERTMLAAFLVGMPLVYVMGWFAARDHAASSPIWVELLGLVLFLGRLRSPLAAVLPLLRAEMGSSPGFMGNPFGNMP